MWLSPSPFPLSPRSQLFFLVRFLSSPLHRDPFGRTHWRFFGAWFFLSPFFSAMLTVLAWAFSALLYFAVCFLTSLLLSLGASDASVRKPESASASPSLYLSTYLPTYLPTCLPAGLSVCLSVRLPASLTAQGAKRRKSPNARGHGARCLFFPSLSSCFGLGNLCFFLLFCYPPSCFCLRRAVFRRVGGRAGLRC
ncbi:hypothetical protein AOQ84DRAFT_33978 [Glonium stellatum]|uniref:Transmembrane protein n=1 Tax=Glonium stellatum TaxID=574774 RepID=A0A8E2JTQ3_9PEZI|nr:hypothetical protein AOQ84DRAFT_33978 [Glonium stellatum]